MTTHLSRQHLEPLYGSMLLIRQVEERLSRLFEAGEIPGFIHLSIGQEAVAAGVGSALRPGDTAASTHRGHGHALAKGVDLDRFFLEILGREDGLCRGRGGSMHVADLSAGMLGANGIVGAGGPIAVGSALAHAIKRTGSIAVAFLGDGALAEGAIHESLNLAALWRLPFLLVCENNGWAEFTPTDRQFAAKLAAVSAAFGIPYYDVDGNDVEAVALAAAAIIAKVRKGAPAVMECRTTRVRGHYEGDAQRYRPSQELSSLAAVDPLARTAGRLRQLGVDDARLNAMADEVVRRIDDAVAGARAGALPDFARARADVYGALTDAA
jgi:pyruvate dehydrogenase E1 component alpha subunit